MTFEKYEEVRARVDVYLESSKRIDLEIQEAEDKLLGAKVVLLSKRTKATRRSVKRAEAKLHAVTASRTWIPWSWGEGEWVYPGYECLNEFEAFETQMAISQYDSA